MTDQDKQTFIQQYIATALWSTNDESTPDGGVPLDQNYEPTDLSTKARAVMTADCVKFLASAAVTIETAAGDYSQAGHDFWLNRNGHGAGFWDGDWPEPQATELDAISKTFGECNLIVGDDGQIHTC